MGTYHSKHQNLDLEMKSLYPRLCGNQTENNLGVRETECQPWDLKMGILYVDRTRWHRSHNWELWMTFGNTERANFLKNRILEKKQIRSWVLFYTFSENKLPTKLHVVGWGSRGSDGLAFVVDNFISPWTERCKFLNRSLINWEWEYSRNILLVSYPEIYADILTFQWHFICILMNKTCLRIRKV